MQHTTPRIRCLQGGGSRRIMPTCQVCHQRLGRRVLWPFHLNIVVLDVLCASCETRMNQRKGE